MIQGSLRRRVTVILLVGVYFASCVGVVPSAAAAEITLVKTAVSPTPSTPRAGTVANSYIN